MNESCQCLEKCRKIKSWLKIVNLSMINYHDEKCANAPGYCDGCENHPDLQNPNAKWHECYCQKAPGYCEECCHHPDPQNPNDDWHHETCRHTSKYCWYCNKHGNESHLPCIQHCLGKSHLFT